MQVNSISVRSIMVGAAALLAVAGPVSADAQVRGGFHGGFGGHGYGHGFYRGGWHGWGGWGGFYGGWGGFGYWPGFYGYPSYAPAYYYYPAPAAYYPPLPSAPAARPAPIPKGQRSYQVFFNFDRSELTSAGSDVVRQAATDASKQGVTRIYLTGHTDTTGTSSYNQQLSDRRAEVVRQALIQDGVPASEIAASGVGKTGLLVPTGDHVREPQNRRVEIIFGNDKTS